jgi:tyrosinase
MPKPKLLTKKGRPVREWTVSAAELKLLRKAKAPPKGVVKKRRLPVALSKLRVVPKRVLARELLRPEWWWPYYFCRPLYRVRKNPRSLSMVEWQRFIHAIEALAESGMPNPTYSEFVQIHIDAMDTSAGMMWGAHAANFLAWHREYLAKLEASLITINPLVTLPYWDWVTDRSAIPAPLTNAADVSEWGITRGSTFNGNSLATVADLNSLLALTDFITFQTTLQLAPFHNRLHVLVGGTMTTSASPADPLFWLHHAFIDKTWSDWQALHPGVNPPNESTVLQPAPIMTRTVAQVLDTRALGYVYG